MKGNLPRVRQKKKRGFQSWVQGLSGTALPIYRVAHESADGDGGKESTSMKRCVEEIMRGCAEWLRFTEANRALTYNQGSEKDTREGLRIKLKLAFNYKFWPLQPDGDDKRGDLPLLYHGSSGYQESRRS